jgi:hypothetical protein
MIIFANRLGRHQLRSDCRFPILEFADQQDIATLSVVWL